MASIFGGGEGAKPSPDLARTTQNMLQIFPSQCIQRNIFAMAMALPMKLVTVLPFCERLRVVGTESLASLLSPKGGESSEVRLSVPTMPSISKRSSDQCRQLASPATLPVLAVSAAARVGRGDEDLLASRPD